MAEKNEIVKSSLSSRVLVAVMSLIIFFGSLSAFLVYNISTQNLLDVSKMHQLHLTQDKAQDIEITINEVFLVSQQLSQEKLLSDALIASPSPLLAQKATELLDHYLIKGLSSTIYVIGTNGTTIVSTDPTFLGKNYGFRPYFFEAIKGNKYVDVGLGITTNKLGYYFSAPIFQGKKILGVVVIKTDPTKIEKIIDYDLLKIDAQTIISDDKGVILFSSKSDRLYNSLGVISPVLAKQEQEFRFPKKLFVPLAYDKVQNDIIKGKTSGTHEILDNIDKQKEVLTYSKVGRYPFYFIIEADAAPYTSTAAGSAIIISILVLGAAAMASFVITIIIRDTLSPISQLVEAANEIGKGNLSYKIPSFSSAELSNLADSFTKMASNLQDLYINLEKKVKERTKDLDERNKRVFESEVMLKEALETSERANKLMVGRELEMLELKKVIKTLKEAKTSHEN